MLSLSPDGSVLANSRSTAASPDTPVQRMTIDDTKPSSPGHRSAHVGPAVCLHSVHTCSCSACARLQVPNPTVTTSTCQVPSDGHNDHMQELRGSKQTLLESTPSTAGLVWLPAGHAQGQHPCGHVRFIVVTMIKRGCAGQLPSTVPSPQATTGTEILAGSRAEPFKAHVFASGPGEPFRSTSSLADWPSSSDRPGPPSAQPPLRL